MVRRMDIRRTPRHVGLVAYLNVRPLVWAFEAGLVAPLTSDGCPLSFRAALPSRLAEQLRRGECDLGIVPVFEWITNPVYTILPAGAIATHGNVGSVVLVANAPLERLQVVRLDPASLTSSHLLLVLRAERRWSFRVESLAPTLDLAPDADWVLRSPEPAGQLLIGDPALAARGRYPFLYDLGSLWFDLTGLPFVFAAWLVHPRARRAPLLEPFRRAKACGMDHLPQIARECAAGSPFSPDFLLHYFREQLCFELGEKEQAGLLEFARLAAKHGLCSRPPELKLHDR